MGSGGSASGDEMKLFRSCLPRALTNLLSSTRHGWWARLLRATPILGPRACLRPILCLTPLVQAPDLV